MIGTCTNIHNLQVVIHGNNNKLSIGKNCIVGGFIEMFTNGNFITIGDRTITSGNVRLVAHGGKYIRIGQPEVNPPFTPPKGKSQSILDFTLRRELRGLEHFYIVLRIYDLNAHQLTYQPHPSIPCEYLALQ